MIKILGAVIIVLLVAIGYVLKNNEEFKKALTDCKNKLKRSGRELP